MESTRRAFLTAVFRPFQFLHESGRCPACGERSAGPSVRRILKESFGSKTSEWAAYCGSCKRSLMREKLT